MSEDNSSTVGRNTADGIPVAPSLAPALASVAAPIERPAVDRRVVYISAISIVLGGCAALIAEALTHLIGLITNLAYSGRYDWHFSPPSIDRLGAWSILVPIVGAVIVGLMARYGAAAIRGHGIPEVMERVLYNRSRISPKIMFLKPLSAAIAIGTGGPFGAEGPIIATGGALGSTIGQILHITADERKILLAAGAAAGMAATFGSPVSSVLLAVELLLFEYRPRSIIPVALASAVATALRGAMVGTEPVFAISTLAQPTVLSLVGYVALGAVIGVVSVYTTRIVYAIEDWYDELPIHWMWWPVIGAIVVGVIGYFAPRTLGVGYYNIDQILNGTIVGKALIVLVVLKFISWSVYLGSGTSGGTLAPLFTVGGGIGALLGGLLAQAVPALGVDARVSALVGMAAIFAGASHAFLASIVFAFETTRQPVGLLPLLVGCSAAYLVSLLMMRSSIMTEKLVRRGARIRTEYAADYLDQVMVRDAATREVVTVAADDTLDVVRSWLRRAGSAGAHQGFPVLDTEGTLVGVVTRRDLLDSETAGDVAVRTIVKRRPAVVFESNTLRETADHMVQEGVGRLPVVTREEPHRLVGIISRSDLLAAHRGRIGAASELEPGTITRRRPRRRRIAS